MPEESREVPLQPPGSMPEPTARTLQPVPLVQPVRTGPVGQRREAERWAELAEPGKQRRAQVPPSLGAEAERTAPPVRSEDSDEPVVAD